MKTVILYYTLGGSTQKEAERLAAELDATLCRVREARRRSLLSAFIPGGPMAMRRKPSAIQPLGIDPGQFDRIVIGCPIWAGYPAPAFNAVAALLPAGKEVELFFCSGGGDSEKSRQGTRRLIEDRGCTVVSYRDVRTSSPPGKSKG